MTVARAEYLVQEKKKRLLSALFSSWEDDKTARTEQGHVEQRGLWRQNIFDKSKIWRHVQGDAKKIKDEPFVRGGLFSTPLQTL